MNKRIVGAVAVLGSILLGPAAVAAEPDAASAPGCGLASVLGEDVFDHGQDGKGDDDHGKDDHDHDGDGRPDHDPEDHDADDDEDDDKTKSDDD